MSLGEKVTTTTLIEIVSKREKRRKNKEALIKR